MHQGKAAGAWSAATEPSKLGRADWGHSDRSPDESIDGGIVSKDAEESLETTTAWLGSALLEGVESREPVGGRGDHSGSRSSWECRWRGEEGNEVVCDEVPVGVGDGELAWAGGSAVDDSGDVDVECGEALGTGNEQAVSGEDCKFGMLALVSSGVDKESRRKGAPTKEDELLTLDQSKRVVGPDETVFSLEGKSNSGHAGIGIGALLIFVVESGHFVKRLGVVKLGKFVKRDLRAGESIIDWRVGS